MPTMHSHGDAVESYVPPEDVPQYIKDKDELFAEHGNGWWWGDGWWNGQTETPMAYHRRKRKERGL